MRLIISHGKTKRQIKGPFSICGSKEDFKRLRNILDKKIHEDFAFGWVNIDKVQDDEGSADSIIRRHNPKPNTSPVSWDKSKDIYDSTVVNAETIKDVMSKLMKKKKEIDEKIAGNFDTHEKITGGFVSHKPESIINKHNKLEMIEQLENIRLGVREWVQQSINNQKPKKRINRVFAIDKKKFDRGISERFKKMNGFSDPTIA